MDDGDFVIYNSRNSKDLIVPEDPEKKEDPIYNSRNSKDLIVQFRPQTVEWNLQQ